MLDKILKKVGPRAPSLNRQYLSLLSTLVCTVSLGFIILTSFLVKMGCRRRCRLTFKALEFTGDSTETLGIMELFQYSWLSSVPSEGLWHLLGPEVTPGFSLGWFAVVVVYSSSLRYFMENVYTVVVFMNLGILIILRMQPALGWSDVHVPLAVLCLKKRTTKNPSKVGTNNL